MLHALGRDRLTTASRRAASPLPHAVGAALLLAAACGGDRRGSPACGMALLIGPTLIQQRLSTPAILATPPRGLVDTLPARVAGEAMGAVAAAYADGGIAMRFSGPRFPPRPGYAVLVVDDTSQRAMGVMIFADQAPPENLPELGTVRAGDVTVPLYGVRVDWVSVSNPRCPLLGPAAPEPTAARR